MAEQQRLMTEADAALYLGVSRSFLRESRMNGIRKHRAEAPPYIRLGGGRATRYDAGDLDLWIDQHRVQLKTYHEVG